MFLMNQNISIPSGAIKRRVKRLGENQRIRISIPSGAIKSLSFQMFLINQNISIPSGAIKRLV